ncbi:MAG: hypothetical protein Fur0024_3060 [Patescibacteria group bacterium]
MKNFYEFVFILPGSLLPDEAEKHKKIVLSQLEKNDAKILEEQNWGRRELAYSIKGEKSGYYALVFFEAESSKINTFRDELKVLPKGVKVLRYIFNKTTEQDFSNTKSMKGDFDMPKDFESKVKFGNQKPTTEIELEEEKLPEEEIVADLQN